jgi:hypothetical protein
MIRLDYKYEESGAKRTAQKYTRDLANNSEKDQEPTTPSSSGSVGASSNGNLKIK